MNKGKLVIISGPSAGVGKDTIVRMFLKIHPDWLELPSVTTRPMRAGEIEGLDYYFVDRPTFEKKVKSGEFLEWVETTGQLYGTLKEPVERMQRTGKNIIMRKDVRGALAIKKVWPKAITVCLLPDKWEALEQQFRKRATETEVLIQARLELAKEELTYQSHFDHLIINPYNRPKVAVAAVEKAAGF
ncbi:guanylate kinase [Candidatus Saccharibacteria bacterium]|nr:guanylate kinase [Candidatus Saccharibacteria bacterium]